MSIAAYIKEIGRGKDGARPLNTAQAKDLFAQVLDRSVTDLEIGAFCLAMRIKGETPEELDGFVQATLARCLPLESAAQAAPGGIVVLPSYNGSRKLANLTALLAAELAQRGVGVLVHGPLQDPARVTSAQVFEAAGLPIVNSAAGLEAAWLAGKPAFMDVATLCPGLAALLSVRWTIGLRNSGHTVAKLLDPFAGADTQVLSLRVVNHTHPEYAQSLADYLKLTHASALLMRGTEGEPVADARRQPRFDVFIHGQRNADLSRAPLDGVLTRLPILPTTASPQDTAVFMATVRAGELPLPPAIEAQVDCLVGTLQHLGR